MIKLQNSNYDKILIIGLLLFPFAGYSANQPCSGNKGGINHCEGSKFVCNDGSTSSSTKNCAVVFGGNTAAPSVAKPSANVTAQTPTVPTTSSQIMKLDYEGFTVWLDCESVARLNFNTTHSMIQVHSRVLRSSR